MEPIFLTIEEVLEIHRDQIQRYGGTSEIRDIGLLASALAMPSAGFGDQYLHTDIFEMAAAYLFHITQNHPFVDGNKRTGSVAAIVFLRMNDVQLDISEEDLVQLVIAVASGKADKSVVSEFFRNHAICG
jgi:death on curing protein